MPRRSVLFTVGTFLFLLVLGLFVLVLSEFGREWIILLGDEEAQSVPERIACEEIMRRQKWPAKMKVLICTTPLRGGGWMVTVHPGWHRTFAGPVSVDMTGAITVDVSRDNKILSYDIVRE
jgi:hypothetical protein